MFPRDARISLWATPARRTMTSVLGGIIIIGFIALWGFWTPVTALILAAIAAVLFGGLGKHWATRDAVDAEEVDPNL
ncbi:hypothetical protein [Plantibacter sp. YIM 135347]|uniref:hypothetical protein n=1 Tax=Plantibacter sp. YIM 135347 TaxID=3423919 RepID=UPI003D33533E